MKKQKKDRTIINDEGEEKSSTRLDVPMDRWEKVWLDKKIFFVKVVTQNRS